MRHDLKCWPEPFGSVLDGSKTHEIRRSDRPYKVGDSLLLREWSPGDGMYTGREILAKVTCLTPGGEWCLPADMCVMSIRAFWRFDTRTGAKMPADGGADA